MIVIFKGVMKIARKRNANIKTKISLTRQLEHEKKRGENSNEIGTEWLPEM